MYFVFGIPKGFSVRIFKELMSNIKLEDLEFLLAPEGRVVIVSFHSLEDSIVKGFFKEHSSKKVARSKYSKIQEEIEPGKWLKIITRKALAPAREEVLRNPRSRSAKLRVAEMLGGSYDS